jgi:hypothetical protein
MIEPIPNTYTTPVLDSDVIQDLQVLFQTELDWLQYVYPIAEIGLTKTENGNEFKYPQVYKNDGNRDYIDLRPNDLKSSYGFFELNSQVQLNEDEVQYNLSFVVWFNFKLVYPNKAYNYSRELIKSIINAIGTDSDFRDRVKNFEYTTDPNRIFDKYSLSIIESQYLMYPYGAFKVTFDYIDYITYDC